MQSSACAPLPGSPRAAEYPLMPLGTILVVAAISALWCGISWFASERLMRERAASLIEAETVQARRDVANIRENLQRVLNRLRGLPFLLASGRDVTAALTALGAGPHSRERTIAGSPGHAELAKLDRFLLGVSGELNVDVAWVMDADGTCVAASNYAEPTTFVGTSYADRSYFQEARLGRRARQYAMGRVTNVPGLFFSSPVVEDDQFLGAVTIKVDLPQLTPWLHHRYAFVTDEYGVVILAANAGLEMRAVPGAGVRDMPLQLRQARYKREAFETLAISPSGADGLVRVEDSPVPHVFARSDLAEYGIAVHILAPVTGLGSLRSDAYAAFALLSVSGTLLTVLVFGLHSYVSRARLHRESMEATNASLNKLNRHLNILATMDPLTDTANRRHFHSRLEAELARTGRYGRACSLLVIDLDHFKQINDSHGHAGGDEALRHFSRIARDKLRIQDEIGRIGGEEFAVLLPETELESAVAVAERIRIALEAAPAVAGNVPIRLSASFGVVCWEGPAETGEGMLQRADAALYCAKSAGRNRVVSALRAGQSNP